ncbi:glycosyltransferase family 4 protein [Vibrio aestuarianus]|uniref:glycosyltransferase family 4 protein n=1 Tax=Vibrio aestuarianus TaxID=28171 RepID=UPI0015594EAB|nr:glycosyltransferase family 4 protein [Vibrio aestuarianus]NGZ14809.1 glycosyltransferase family 4 protein [Vibrio aestuarianus]NKZ50957.1 glycosyltransferase family 4 protein [Vibrio aestuarianus]
MKESTVSKVWLLLDSLVFGGIETYVLELARGLQSHNVNVEIVFIQRYEKSNQLALQLTEYQIPFFYLSDRYPTANSFCALIQAVKDEKPRVIHSHGYKASIISKLLMCMPGCQVRQISTFHAGETPKGRVWLYDAFDRYTSFLSKHRFAVSEKVAQKIPYSALVLNNFINVENLAVSQGKQIAFVGRMSHEKAPDHFLRLAQASPNLSFHCYGSGPMEKILTAKKSHNLKLHGHQIAMNTVWPNIALLVICSRYEGLPMAALEAMARGIPIATVDVGDLPKLVIHGNNGFIVDHYSQLSDVIEHWSAMSAQQKMSLNQHAKQTIQEHYSSDVMIPTILGFYFT